MGLPGSCHTGEAAACPRGGVGFRLQASGAAPPVTGTAALGSLPPRSTGVLSVKQKMVLPTPRGVVRLGERSVRTIRAGTEGMHNKGDCDSRMRRLCLEDVFCGLVRAGRFR